MAHKSQIREVLSDGAYGSSFLASKTTKYFADVKETNKTTPLIQLFIDTG